MHSASWEPTGISRLYRRFGVKLVSWIYRYPGGGSRTLARAPIGDREAIREAGVTAARLALEAEAGRVLAGSVAEMIQRFEQLAEPVHYADQSADGRSNRKAAYANLMAFFGKMSPPALKLLHGYQYLDARAAVGAPARANKEMALMQTICHYGVRWALLPANPFVNLKLNVTERRIRSISRRQVVRFYLWSVRQPIHYRILGCAALFTYLTGFRASEVRPFLTSGLTKLGVQVVASKRKRGEDPVVKLRNWTPRLRTVVARARARPDAHASPYLFAPSRQIKGRLAYTRSGWNSTWADAMTEWIATFDNVSPEQTITLHPAYFALQDIRPAAISSKFESLASDVYDFAAHASPQTTHREYDRRRVRKASATE